MIVFPNCKINLGLRITGKRDDGYHNLETIFFPLSLNDALEVLPAADNVFGLTITGRNVPGDASTNLCRRAWELLRTHHPAVGGVRIHLHKAIPIGGGLGGGSADGAFTLIALNRLFNLGLMTEQLLTYALQLGSDCPFFITNTPCIATGRGEIMQPVNVTLQGYYLLLVNPGVHVSTAEAFAALAASRQKTSAPTHRESLAHIISKSPAEWQNVLMNEFEEPVFHAHPALRNIRDLLVNAGATYTSLTGTGSCIYAIFKNEMSPPRLPSSLEVHQLKPST